MSLTELQKAMDNLLAASLAHHTAESAVYRARGADGAGIVPEDTMRNLDKAAVDLRSTSRIYASLQKKMTAKALIGDRDNEFS